MTKAGNWKLKAIHNSNDEKDILKVTRFKKKSYKVQVTTFQNSQDKCNGKKYHQCFA